MQDAARAGFRFPELIPEERVTPRFDMSNQLQSFIAVAALALSTSPAGILRR